MLAWHISYIIKDKALPLGPCKPGVRVPGSIQSISQQFMLCASSEALLMPWGS